jgi:CMP-N,N'-diacetyllegionaminic acid synthase
MYKNNYVLGIIPARGGSKGIPNKNIKDIAGKPLIAWSIEQGKASALIDRVIISTDSADIAAIAKKHGGDVPFIRPTELSQDTTAMYPVLQHAVREIERANNKKVDVIMLLDVTAPTRTIEDVDNCIRKVIDDKLDTVMTVFESNFNPYFNMVTVDEKGLAQVVIKPKTPVYRRQDAPKVFNIASGAYAIKRTTLMDENTIIGKKTGAIIIPEERAGGIDTPTDFEHIELLMKKRKYV